jgi:HEAT repeat protein
MRPAGAVALVALGFFAARLTTTDTGEPLVAPFLGGSSVNAATTQVRLVEPAGEGTVRIVVDETRQRELSGSIEDERIRGLLLNALRDPSDAGVRVESVELLKSRQNCEDTKQALLYALANDPNDGVRLKAIEGLRPYAGDPESRRILSRALLHDDNPGVRTTAIELLIQSDEVDVVETLQELLRREDNSYLRLRCQRALQDMNASVETF